MTDRTYHIIGPPGTGKTRYLAQQAENAVNARGSKSVLICSLTRAAAHEIAGRGTPVAEDNIGTLHAHAFRALGCPTIAETVVEEWNDKCESRHVLTDSKNNQSIIDAPENIIGQTEGDKCLSMVNILRAEMTPEDLWVNASAINFYQCWNDWKQENGYMDFTDLIENAIQEVPVHPSNPSVLLGDEAQDWSKLEATLFREIWGKHADTVILAGDEDQSLYVWRGSDPHIFSEYPIPEENTKVLEQSYRVPRAVHKESQAWIRRIKNRTDVAYHPRDYEGYVRNDWDYTYINPEQMISEIESKDGTVMILASCGYMINNVCSFLRKAGVAFHNPYRTTNGGWNPLLSRKDSLSAADRLYAFLNPDNLNGGWARWTKESMQKWITPLASKGFLRHGVKEMVKAGDFKVPACADDWTLIFEREDDILPCIDHNLDWYGKHVLQSKTGPMDFAVRIAKKGKLTEKPKVIVGTIHSVKGGEVDHVFVFPDISYAAKKEGNMEGIIRMFYVAMTRAKKTLTLCGPASKNSVFW